jgi:uncharacterized protein YjbI with pentapeptide repeats
MNDKLTNYLNGVFAPYDGVKSVAELKADLFSDLQERFNELKAEDKDEATAFKLTIDSIGDIEQTVQEVANLSRTLERQVRINLTAIDLQESDFVGVVLHNGKFKASQLRGADFSGADLTGSSFEVSDAREANFDGANLTDCNFSITDLTGASFRKAILVRTDFNTSGLTRARFSDVRLIDARLTMTDLRETIFDNCTFTGVDFKYCDLRGQCLDGLAFIGVKFDRTSLNEVTFKGATLRNVSFRPVFALTNKNYLAMKTINFDGAMMDKLTWAALKGLGVDFDLSKVTVI